MVLGIQLVAIFIGILKMLTNENVLELKQFLDKNKSNNKYDNLGYEKQIDMFSDNKKIIKKRRLIEYYFVFLFQSISTFFLNAEISTPIYFPVGMAFTLIYLRGERVIPMLFIGGFVSYIANTGNIISSLQMTFLDVLSGWGLAIIGHKVILSDVRPFKNIIIFLKFLSFSSIFLLFTSCARGLIININYLNIFLAEINSVVILSGYILNSIYKSEKRLINKFTSSLFLLSIVLFLLSFKFNQLTVYFSLGLFLLGVVSYTYCRDRSDFILTTVN